MDTKEVIVLRKDLNMRKGKMVAQGSHAAMGTILGLMRDGKSHLEYIPKIVDGKYTMTLTVDVDSPLDMWLRGSFKKICVSVNSEQELIEIYEKAKEQGLLVSLIQDSGLTEFGGVPTLTAVAIGPDDSEKINLITGHLPLL